MIKNQSTPVSVKQHHENRVSYLSLPFPISISVLILSLLSACLSLSLIVSEVKDKRDAGFATQITDYWGLALGSHLYVSRYICIHIHLGPNSPSLWLRHSFSSLDTPPVLALLIAFDIHSCN